MVTAMAIDGNTQRCQYERMYCWPSPTIWPHEGVGGLIPTPMNESAASVKIASGMPNVTATTMGVSALGMMCRPSSRPKPAPRARAPSTYSFSLMTRTCARVWRAIPTHPVRPIGETGEGRPGVGQRRQEVGEDRDQAEQDDDAPAGHRQPIAQEPPHAVAPEARPTRPRRAGSIRFRARALPAQVLLGGGIGRGAKPPSEFKIGCGGRGRH